MNKDIPDPSVDWDFINYTAKSDSIRPSVGWRVCTKCGNTYPVNNYHFSRNRRNPDGYTYECKECQKKYRKEKQNEKTIETTKENNE